MTFLLILAVEPWSGWGALKGSLEALKHPIALVEELIEAQGSWTDTPELVPLT
jgi:hypothetical protein